MTDEAAEKRRFQSFVVLRLIGVGLFLFGTAVAFTGLLKPGGWPLLGGILAIAGALEAVLASRIVRGVSERK